MPVLALDAGFGLQVRRALPDPQYGPKYGPNRSRAIELRGHNPCLTLRQISFQLNLSRERVRQILNKAGISTKGTGTCRGCGRQITHIHESFRLSGLCGYCRQRLRKHKQIRFTGAAVFVDTPCIYCGQTVHRQISSIQRNLKHGGKGNVACNRVCHGKWLAAHHGFGVHPEHMLRK